MLATLALPLSALELRDAVRLARPFNTARLDRVLRLDASRGLVEVQGSASWPSLAAYLRPSVGGELAAVWADSAMIGESVAANAPGPDGRPAVEHIEALTLVTADGELRRISRSSDAELFNLAIGGQGLFGALYSVTLRLESLARAASNALPSAALLLRAGARPTTRVDVLVPPGCLEPFLEATRSRCMEWRIALEAVEVRRTFPETVTLLRWARCEYAAVALTLATPAALGGSVRITQLRRELIDSAIAHGGSFPIASNRCATRLQAEACYPELRGFLAEKRRLDPAEKLTNDWYRHYRALLSSDACEVRWN